MTRAFILFAHGARDARWSRTLDQLAVLLGARAPAVKVFTAFLEFQRPTLAEAFDAALAAGCTRIDLAPIFWASGGHVANDLPPLLDALRAANPQIEIVEHPVLSELPGLLDFIAQALITESR